MKKATRNFSTVLGGENGTVFRGQLNDGSVVAIRRVECSPKQSQNEFCKEMEFLGRLHHRHLVGLKGFCSTRFERLISVVLKFRYLPIYGSYSVL
jgi:serine/threonine protein kinase